MNKTYQRRIETSKRRIGGEAEKFIESLNDVRERIEEWASDQFDKDHDELGNQLDEAAMNMADYILTIEEEIKEMLEQLDMDFEI